MQLSTHQSPNTESQGVPHPATRTPIKHRPAFKAVLLSSSSLLCSFLLLLSPWSTFPGFQDSHIHALQTQVTLYLLVAKGKSICSISNLSRASISTETQEHLMPEMETHQISTFLGKCFVFRQSQNPLCPACPPPEHLLSSFCCAASAQSEHWQLGKAAGTNPSQPQGRTASLPEPAGSSSVTTRQLNAFETNRGKCIFRDKSERNLDMTSRMPSSPSPAVQQLE